MTSCSPKWRELPDRERPWEDSDFSRAKPCLVVIVDAPIELWHNPKTLNPSQWEKAMKRTSRSVDIFSEPGAVGAGKCSRAKIISEPRAENSVSKLELFFVTRTG
jgi:hypothetical protein